MMIKKVFGWMVLLVSCCVFNLSAAIAQRAVELDYLVNPSQIIADPESGNCYIADNTTIYILSIPDFKLIKKFGKNGEGPREFKRRAHLHLDSNHLIVNSLSRVTFFSKDGNYIREVNTKYANLGPFLPIGSHYVNTSMDRSEKILKYALNLYDKNFTKLRTIGHFSRNEQPGKKINAIDWGFPKFRVHRGRIYCEELDNELLIFDRSGKQIKRLDIHKQIPGYQPVPVSEAYKKRFFHILKLRARQEYERVKKQLRFPTHFTVIRDYLIRENHIYVISFIKQDEHSEVHVFDLDGDYERTLFLPNIEQNAFAFYPIDIRGGKVYQVYENEDEEWCLSVSQLK